MAPVGITEAVVEDAALYDAIVQNDAAVVERGDNSSATIEATGWFRTGAARSA